MEMRKQQRLGEGAGSGRGTRIEGEKRGREEKKGDFSAKREEHGREVKKCDFGSN